MESRGLENLDPIKAINILISLLEEQEGIKVDYTIKEKGNEND